MIYPFYPFDCDFSDIQTTTQHRVYDIIKNSGVLDSDNVLQIVVSGETLADYYTVLDLWLKRAEWFYNQSKLQHYELHGEEITGGYIFAEWGFYIARNGQNLKRAIDAMKAEYNPIDNYNMVEQGADGEKIDNVRTTPHGTITNTTTPYQTGINSTGDGAQTGKTTTETTYNNADSETEHDNTLSIPDNDGGTVSGFHTGKQHYFKRSGNVGTTQTQTMIENEILLRKHDIIADFVKRFFDTYCYFVG